MHSMRSKSKFCLNPQSSQNLELTIKKFEIIQKALRSIQNMPELSKAGVLFNSILSELSIMRDSVQSYIAHQGEVRQSLNENREEQLEQHNYIIEFYDNKIKNQQTQIIQLQSVNERLLCDGESNRRQLQILEDELINLRRQIQRFQGKQQMRQHQQTQMLMSEVDCLIQELRQKDLIIQDLSHQISQCKSQSQNKLRQQQFTVSQRILEINKILDNTKAQYMKLTQELQLQKEVAKQQNFELLGRMIINEAKLKQSQNKILEKNKQIANLSKIIEQKQQYIELHKKQQSKNSISHQELLSIKQNQQVEVENQLYRASETLVNVQNKLKAKISQNILLEKENCKLHQFLNEKENQIQDQQRSLSICNSKYQQQKKCRESLEWQMNQFKQEVKDLSNKLDLASKFKIELQRERQEKMTVLKQVNQKMTDYDLKFSEIREIQFKKQQQFRKYINVLKKQYEEIINKLVSDLKENEGFNKQLKAQITNQNNRLEIQSIQLKKQRRELIQLRQKIQENNQLQNKHRQSQSEHILLQREVSELKKSLKQLSIQNSQVIILKRKIKELSQELEQSHKREIQYQQKTLKLTKQFEKQNREMQNKILKMNESLAQKQLEIAELSARNKSLLQQIGSTKRSSALDRTRLQSRLTELEKVIKNKKNFQNKVNSLIL